MDTKKDGDVEMKADGPQILTAQGDATPEGEGKPAKRKEPTFETISNFSRVTPAQSAYVVFPSTSRYQPMRPLSVRSPPAKGAKSSKASVASERYAGGGGILMLLDQRPSEPTEYVEFYVPPEPPAVATSDGQTRANVPGIALDESVPDAEPPQSFEVRDYAVRLLLLADDCLPAVSVRQRHVKSRRVVISTRSIVSLSKREKEAAWERCVASSKRVWFTISSFLLHPPHFASKTLLTMSERPTANRRESE